MLPRIQLLFRVQYGKSFWKIGRLPTDISRKYCRSSWNGRSWSETLQIPPHSEQRSWLDPYFIRRSRKRKDAPFNCNDNVQSRNVNTNGCCRRTMRPCSNTDG